MDFEFVGDITGIETIAAGPGIRHLPRLRRLYGKATGGRSFNAVGRLQALGHRASRSAFGHESLRYRPSSTRNRCPAPRRMTYIPVFPRMISSRIERDSLGEGASDRFHLQYSARADRGHGELARIQTRKRKKGV